VNDKDQETTPSIQPGLFQPVVEQDGQEGSQDALVSKMRHEDAESSARLRVMLNGCAKKDMNDIAKFDGSRMIENAQDKLLEKMRHLFSFIYPLVLMLLCGQR
jgi:hypothetical protein